jgi:hypothetical protein
MAILLDATRVLKTLAPWRTSAGIARLSWVRPGIACSPE